ncbi:MAG: tyrosine-protein kinase family protein, partial [Candidatus Rokuibacteriota bacterium]
MTAASSAAAKSNRRGRVITFYSYKGGTGRSMALANVGWVLAANGKRVLMIDWDLEAPGLHRYVAPFLVDKELTASDGLIDFLAGYAAEAVTPLEAEGARDDDWYEAHAAKILDHAISVEWAFPDGGLLDLLPAGRQGPTYATRVTSFNWQNFYERLGGHGFIEAAKARMREDYDFILVDSRTGVSDTAGICTVQLPDVLVVCLTLNNQSIEGAAAVTRSVRGQRVDRGFDVFPVATRVENSEKEKLAVRWKLAKDRFAESPAMGGGPEARERYWQDVAVPYMPYYAYEELLAPFGNVRGDPPSINLLLCMERLAQRISGVSAVTPPIAEEVRRQVLEHYRTGTGALSPAELQRREVEASVRAEAARRAEDAERRRREDAIIASTQAAVSEQYEGRVTAAEQA